MFRRRSQIRDSSSQPGGTSSRSFIRSLLSSSSTAGSLRSRSPSNALDDNLPPYLDLSLPRTDLRVEFGAPGDLPKVVESSSAKVGDAAGPGGGVGNSGGSNSNGGGGRRTNGVVAAFRKGSAPSAFTGGRSKHQNQSQQGQTTNGPTKDYLKFELAPVTSHPIAPTADTPPAQTDALMFASERPVTPPWAEEVLAAAPSNIALDGVDAGQMKKGDSTAALKGVLGVTGLTSGGRTQVHEGLATPGVTKDAQASFVASSEEPTATTIVASPPSDSTTAAAPVAAPAPAPTSSPSSPSSSTPFPTTNPTTTTPGAPTIPIANPAAAQAAPAPSPPLAVQATAPPSSPSRSTSFLRNLTPRSLRTKKSHQSDTLGQQSPVARNAELPSPTEAPAPVTPKASKTTVGAATGNGTAVNEVKEEEEEVKTDGPEEQQVTPKPDTGVLAPAVDAHNAPSSAPVEQEHPPTNGLDTAAATATAPSQALTVDKTDTATMNLQSDAGSMLTAEAGAETEAETEFENGALPVGGEKRMTGQGLRMLDPEFEVPSAPAEAEAQVQEDSGSTAVPEQEPKTSVPVEATQPTEAKEISHPAEATSEAGVVSTEQSAPTVSATAPAAA